MQHIDLVRIEIFISKKITCEHQVTLQHIKQENNKKLELNTHNKTMGGHQVSFDKTLVATMPNPTKP